MRQLRVQVRAAVAEVVLLDALMAAGGSARRLLMQRLLVPRSQCAYRDWESNQKGSPCVASRSPLQLVQPVQMAWPV